MLPLDDDGRNHPSKSHLLSRASPWSLEDPQCYLNFSKTYLICEMSVSRPPFWLYIGFTVDSNDSRPDGMLAQKANRSLPCLTAPYPVPSVCVSLSAFPSKCSLLLPRVRIHGSCMCKPLTHVLNYELRCLNYTEPYLYPNGWNWFLRRFVFAESNLRSISKSSIQTWPNVLLN